VCLCRRERILVERSVNCYVDKEKGRIKEGTTHVAANAGVHFWL
jgi:hypothetical protein